MLARVATVFTVLAVSGCATLVKDDQQFIAVRSDPPGATCQVRQGGDVIGIVAETPGTIFVHKGRHEIGVDCSLAGYNHGAAVIPTQFQDMTYTNSLLGPFSSSLGYLVDISTGAISEYPHVVTVLLEPISATYTSEADRERWRFRQIGRARLRTLERDRALGGW